MLSHAHYQCHLNKHRLFKKKERKKLMCFNPATSNGVVHDYLQTLQGNAIIISDYHQFYLCMIATAKKGHRNPQSDIQSDL